VRWVANHEFIIKTADFGCRPHDRRHNVQVADAICWNRVGVLPVLAREVFGGPDLGKSAGGYPFPLNHWVA
ncbi:MAG: hypothetical protein WA996_19540, partial [Candidatus Promineifilaceae bacterium]